MIRDTVSHSEAEQFLRCNRAHYYGYILEIMRRDTSDSLARGTIAHTAMEAYFKIIQQYQQAMLPREEGIEAAKKAVNRSLLEAFMLAPELAAQVKETLDWFYEAEPFKLWDILYVEEDFMLELEDGLKMPFKPDLIARDPDGKVWLIDHKCVYDFYTPRDAELQPQLPKYLYGLHKLGIHIDKIGYHSLRWRSLKDDPKKAGPMVKRRNNLFGFEVPPARAVETMREQIVVSKEVQRRKALPLVEANAIALRAANKMVCNNCSFRSLCIAELNNTNPKLVLDSEYVKRDRIVYENKRDDD